MNEILEYFKNIFIIMILSMPIYCIIRFVILKIDFNKNKKRELYLILFILYMIALTLQIITPKFIIDMDGIHIISQNLDNINIIPFYFFKDFYNECIVLKNYNYFFINIIGNIILFIPIGIFLPFLWNIPYKKVLIYGIIFSITVELIQIFLPRVSDIDDIILNNTGVFIGIKLYNKFICKGVKQNGILNK